MKADKRR